MRKLRTAFLTGATALAVAGAALAASRDMHVMNVGLPDGSVARIEYAGDSAPKVVVAPTPAIAPVGSLGAFDMTPFAAFDRIVASMNRDMDTMIHEISAGPVPPSRDGMIDFAALSKMSPGTVHYQFVSSSDGSTTCSRSVEVTYLGSDQKTRVVSNSSGDCTRQTGRQRPSDSTVPPGQRFRN